MVGNPGLLREDERGIRDGLLWNFFFGASKFTTLNGAKSNHLGRGSRKMFLVSFVMFQMCGKYRIEKKTQAETNGNREIMLKWLDLALVGLDLDPFGWI